MRQLFFGCLFFHSEIDIDEMPSHGSMCWHSSLLD